MLIVHPTIFNFISLLMLLSLGRRERTPTSQRRSADPQRSAFLYRTGVLVCVLLVLLIGYVAATHFHANDLDGTDHSCSLCALAHAGVAVNSVDSPAPIFAPSIVADVLAITAHSFLLVSSYYIRPPPQL